MKVMSYNVSWCNPDKIDWLLRHDDVDVFVIPECGDEEHVCVPKGFRFFWTGDYANECSCSTSGRNIKRKVCNRLHSLMKFTSLSDEAYFNGQ